MKTKLLLINLLVILFFSCKKEDDINQYFSFKLNGTYLEYRSFGAINNFYKKGFTTIKAGDSENIFNSNKSIDILVKIEGKQDYNINDSLIVSYIDKDNYLTFSAPKTYYDFSITNPNPDSLIIDRETTKFNLTIDKYDTVNKIIEGRFNGLLRNISTSNTDSIVISEGKFKIDLENNTEKGLFDTDLK